MAEITCKILLIGNEGVGKTSLIKRFVYSSFSEEYMTTIGVKVSKKTLSLDSDTVNLVIWDVAGDMLTSMAYRRYLAGAAGVIWVYDLTDEISRTSILEEKTNLLATDSSLKNIIVGNKSDLPYQPENHSDTDVITSAKEDSEVETAFSMLAQLIREAK